jgi:hypothetical protein
MDVGRFAHGWRRIGIDRFFVAGRRAALGPDAARLTGGLGCDRRTALRVGACRAPVAGEDVDARAARVAGRFGLDLGRVRALAEEFVRDPGGRR